MVLQDLVEAEMETEVLELLRQLLQEGSTEPVEAGLL
jgi:hypothetical protein